MSHEARRLREAVVQRALEGPGHATPDARGAAFHNREVAAGAAALVDTVARHAWKVTDAHVAVARAAGLSEDEIFELTVCAALGQATRQLTAALTALDRAVVSPAPAVAGAEPSDGDRT
jgi:alkylhydroperoxidase family enzyme